MRDKKRYKKWLAQKECGNALANSVFVITPIYYLESHSLYIKIYKDKQKFNDFLKKKTRMRDSSVNKLSISSKIHYV